MESDGSPWRPIVHVLDICEAIACALDAPRERIHNEVLNVGDTSSNYRIRELAEIVGDVFPDCSVSIAGRSPDSRSYRVSFEKIRELHARRSPARGTPSGARASCSRCSPASS